MPVRGRGAWGPAALHEDDPEGVIQKYEVMRKPGAEKAIVLLKEVGQSVKTLIQLRGWRLPVLREFYPRNSNLLGLNYNQGQKICLRLRDSANPAVFLGRDEILRTHNVRGPHDTLFYEALQSLTSEYETAQRLGYWPGAGFLSAGARLGGRRGSLPTLQERRILSAEAAVRRQTPPLRLGGTPPSPFVPLRDLAAEAALRRQADAQICASASQVQLESALTEMQGDGQDIIEVLDSDDDDPVPSARGTRDDPIVMD